MIKEKGGFPLVIELKTMISNLNKKKLDIFISEYTNISNIICLNISIVIKHRPMKASYITNTLSRYNNVHR